MLWTHRRFRKSLSTPRPDDFESTSPSWSKNASPKQGLAAFIFALTARRVFFEDDDGSR